MIKNKKQMIISISAFILVLMLTTVTFAFFNYTRTGTANVIRTGRISFNANQTETINLTNVFPIDKTTIGTDTVNTDETVITITGDTTYTDGIEYLVTAVDVNNTIGSGNNQKTVPISVSVTASNGLGTEDEEYFDNRENANSHLYRVLAGDVLEENGRIAVGYIKAGSTGVNGILTIKAYLDKARIAITDTYDGNESDNMGTTTEWVDNRTVLTTTEWNALQTNGVSFKVKVESNEGIWVEEELSINAIYEGYFLTNDGIFGNSTNRSELAEKVKEVYFNKMGATRMQQAYDAATIKLDLTKNNEGKVLAWLEENQDDNTMYNLIIASDGETYISNSPSMFSAFVSMERIYFNNINTSRLTFMTSMFENCLNLTEIDLSMFDVSNITSYGGLENIFKNCPSLKEINLSGWIINSYTSQYWFDGCTNLEKVYVSSSMNFDNTLYSANMFNGCTSLVGGNGTTYDESNPKDKTYAIIDGTNGQPGYFTDIADKPTN